MDCVRTTKPCSAGRNAGFVCERDRMLRHKVCYAHRVETVLLRRMRNWHIKAIKKAPMLRAAGIDLDYFLKDDQPPVSSIHADGDEDGIYIALSLSGPTHWSPDHIWGMKATRIGAAVLGPPMPHPFGIVTKYRLDIDPDWLRRNYMIIIPRYCENLGG